MEKQNKTKQIVIALITLVLTLTVTIGLTYAFFTAITTGDENTETIRLTAGSLTIHYTNTKSIESRDLLPNPGPNFEPFETKRFTVTGNNNTDLPMNYFINLHITENTFSNHAIEFKMIGNNEGNSGTLAPDITVFQKLPSDDGIYPLGEGSFIMSNNIIHAYELSFYFRDRGIEQNENQGAKLLGYINISAEPGTGELGQPAAPIINVPEPELIIETFDDFDLMEYITAFDKQDGDLTDHIEITSEPEFDSSKTGTYVITYTVTNSYGISTKEKRVITIIDELDLIISHTLSPTTLTDLVVLTVTTNKSIPTPPGFTRVNDTTYTREFTENFTGIIEIRDRAGRVRTININITNIGHGIRTANQLYNIGRIPSMGLNQSYILSNNIDMKDCSPIEDKYGFVGVENCDINWQPIVGFSGLFEGNNKTIFNLTIDNHGVETRGLFANLLAGGTIRNLFLDHVDIKGGTNTGGLVGINNGTITNVGVRGSINCNGASCGGLTGHNNGSISTSYTNVEMINTENNTGGLVGMHGNGTISMSFSNGTIRGTNHVGGLIGQAGVLQERVTRTVDRTYSGATVIGSGAAIGGLIGAAEAFNTAASGNSNLNITNSFAVGDVTGVNEVGGLLGRARRNGSQVGGAGLTIANLVIQNTYSSGKVTGTTIGGLVGNYINLGFGTSTITNNFWMSDESGVFTSHIGLPISTEAATISATFTTWNFATIWGIIEDGEDRSSPFIRGLIIPDKAFLKNLDYYRFEGSGNATDPYHIYTETDLHNVRRAKNSFFILKNDIDLDVYSNWNPITDFRGSLNGDGKTIRNFVINQPGVANRGLFANLIAGSSVSNIRLENVVVSGGTITGAVVGNNAGTVSNVSVTGSITCDGNDCGGIVGHNTGNISGSFAVVNVITTVSNVGGLVGNHNSGTVNLSYTAGEIRGVSGVGGLIGRVGVDNSLTTRTVDRTYSEARVFGTGNAIGGLIGAADAVNVVASADSRINITNSFAVGDVVGVNEVGGLIGRTRRHGATVGGAGLTVANLTIQNNYSLGKVTGTTVGGFTGSLTNLGNGVLTSTNNFWLSDESGVFTCPLGTPISTEAATNPATFTSWNFTTIWASVATGDDRTSPYLRGLVIPEKVYLKNLDYYRFEGSGSTSDPYHIKTETDLYNIRRAKNAHFILINNIDLDVYSNWEPITDFRGSLNGDGFRIRNLVLNLPTTNNIGLFTNLVPGSTVRNIFLEDVDITGRGTVGALVGTNNATITNVGASGTVRCSLDNCGGIVGHNTGTISGSYTDINIISTSNHVGGLVGLHSNGAISTSYTSGEIRGAAHVGGLIGTVGIANERVTRTVDRTYSNATVIGTGNIVGGLIGFADAFNTAASGNSVVSITNSFAVGNVTGAAEVGGFIGRARRNGATVGGAGLTIANLAIQNVYSLGTVNGTSSVGGLMGMLNNVGNGTLTNTNNFWNTETSNLSTSALGTGRTSGQMVLSSTFTTWNFSTVWNIIEGSTSPFLRGLMIPDEVYLD